MGFTFFRRLCGFLGFAIVVMTWTAMSVTLQDQFTSWWAVYLIISGLGFLLMLFDKRKSYPLQFLAVFYFLAYCYLCTVTGQLTLSNKPDFPSWQTAVAAFGLFLTYANGVVGSILSIIVFQRNKKKPILPSPVYVITSSNEVPPPPPTP